MTKSKQTADLSLDELRLILSIMEGPSLKVGGAKLLGTGSRPFERLRDRGALAQKERAKTIICQECDRRHRATVNFDPERNEMTYFCSEAGRVAIQPAVLDVFELQLPWILDWIAENLRIPRNQRPICLLQDRLWELGEANIHHRRLRVMLARRVESRSALTAAETIAGRRTGKTGLILTTSSNFTEPHRLTSGFSMISLSAVLVRDRAAAAIDLNRLLTIAEPEATIEPYASGGPGPRSGAHFVKAEHQRRISGGKAAVRIGEESRALERWYAENHGDGPGLTADTIANIIRNDHNRYRASHSSTS